MLLQCMPSSRCGWAAVLHCCCMLCWTWHVQQQSINKHAEVENIGILKPNSRVMVYLYRLLTHNSDCLFCAVVVHRCTKPPPAWQSRSCAAVPVSTFKKVPSCHPGPWQRLPRALQQLGQGGKWAWGRRQGSSSCSSCRCSRWVACGVHRAAGPAKLQAASHAAQPLE